MATKVRSDWRRLRVVVELPAHGNYTEKDLRWAVEAVLERSTPNLAIRLTAPGSRGIRFGKMEVKEFQRVLTAATRERETRTPEIKKTEAYLQEQIDALGHQVDKIDQWVGEQQGQRRRK